MSAAAGWRKSSHSNEACVEVRLVPDGAEMRHSKDASGPVLRFTPAEWAAFLDGVHDGEFDDLAGAR
jgi:uncharacterized protein DUF397